MGYRRRLTTLPGCVRERRGCVRELGIRSFIILAVRFIGSSRASWHRGETSHEGMEAEERFVHILARIFGYLTHSLQSIYGGKFNDEKAGLKAKFKRGSLAMANSGKNTNSSQFFVVLTDDESQLAKLHGKYVLFGQLREGWEVLNAIDEVGGPGADGKPKRPVWVGGCGVSE